MNTGICALWGYWELIGAGDSGNYLAWNGELLITFSGWTDTPHQHYSRVLQVMINRVDFRESWIPYLLYLLPYIIVFSQTWKNNNDWGEAADEGNFWIWKRITHSQCRPSTLQTEWVIVFVFNASSGSDNMTNLQQCRKWEGCKFWYNQSTDRQLYKPSIWLFNQSTNQSIKTTKPYRYEATLLAHILG